MLVVSLSKIKGLGLVEFMISIALSLSAILVITSLYVTSMTIDTKSVRFSRFNDEISTMLTLMTEDIKRAGYSSISEQVLTTAVVSGNASRCDPDASGCTDSNFRTIAVGAFADEVANSCIIFAYDENSDGDYDTNGVAPADDVHEGFGYRLHDGAIEARQAGASCTAGGWQSITDSEFVIISGLTFTCLIDDVTLCAAGTLPATGLSTVTVNIAFTATLAADDEVSLQTNETVLVKNASYK